MNTTDNEDVITRRTLETDEETPAAQIPALVAALEDREPTDLSPVYYSVNELLSALFSSPPRATADATVEFTYEGYRFRVRQDGTATVARAER
ncbi:HalOD1 output domain-containing protein [Natronococcus jeotgali]|uniref:Halobacterial output domain-containing protein n=1 Tax=Natronococcus jeotgali DSM 18795 TaxID=1227498 RepID=L9XB22_9EURY|nr:HalOD1 output domain-containing protein [Natronococcus jeotgali]ELY57818.1 hypothetical protein C492_12889 [Natronococcus jeotgali DSM 18795]